MKNIQFFTIISLCTLALVQYSCHWGTKKPKPKGRNFTIIVDFSDGESADERMEFYKNVIKTNIIPKLGINDRINVIAADKATITNAADILVQNLSEHHFEPEQASPAEEDELISENLKKYKDTLINSFELNYAVALKDRAKTKHGTDIFGALEIVKSKLSAADDNYLIILSDMMNFSNVLSMEPGNKAFNKNTMGKILNTVPNYSMPNTTALVLTAEQAEASPEHFQLVQAFWTKYFEKNHIKLYDYNSASTSKLDELMELPVFEL